MYVDSPGIYFERGFQMAVLAHGRPLGFFGVASDTKIVYFVFPLAALVTLGANFYPVIVSVFVMTGETVYAGLFVLEMGDFNLAHQPPGFDHSGLEVRIAATHLFTELWRDRRWDRIDRGCPSLHPGKARNTVFIAAQMRKDIDFACSHTYLLKVD